MRTEGCSSGPTARRPYRKKKATRALSVHVCAPRKGHVRTQKEGNFCTPRRDLCDPIAAGPPAS